MISLVSEFRRPILEPPERNPLPFEPRPTPRGGSPGRVSIVCTAHSTGKSMPEAETIRDGLLRVGLNYSPPVRIRRVQLN